MASHSYLINSPESVVEEAIDGLLLTDSRLCMLDNKDAKDIKVVLRDGWRKEEGKVALISGGGSGHEPAHAGFVGQGMLTAAVCGNVFASPSRRAVEAAIRSVNGPAGTLLIVKNYTGDRLHFGAAAEAGQQREGSGAVEMVVVGDDVALEVDESKSIVGRRGVAGTLFVHKAAGAAAAEGAPLDRVKAVAQEVAGRVRTLGISLTSCTLPGQPTSDRIKQGEVEMGLGIHGEPGAATRTTAPASELVASALEKIGSFTDSCPLWKAGGGRPGEAAVLINNLGGLTGLEMGVVVREALKQLPGALGMRAIRVYSGPFMTSLEMRGVSISVLPLAPDDPLLPLLDSPVSTVGWCGAMPASGMVPPQERKVVPIPEGVLCVPKTERPAEPSEAGRAIEAAITAAANAAIGQKAALDALDAVVGDGDAGTTLALGGEQLLKDLPAYPLNSPAGCLRSIAHSIEASMGGSSGALYGILFMRAANALEASGDAADVAKASAAFRAGVEAVSAYGGARAGHRTMLDALLPATAAAEEAVDGGKAAPEVLAAAAAAARKGADATMGMEAGAGRSSYVPKEKLEGSRDPGAVGVAEWMEAVAAACR